MTAYIWYEVRGVDALCHHGKTLVEASSHEEAAAIFMGDTREVNAVLDSFTVEARTRNGKWRRYTMTATVTWDAEPEE